jgi:hypothetical protein
VICSNGKIDAEINKKEVQTETKMQLFESVYIPILSYAADSWATSKNENRITAAEMKFLR